MKKIILLTILLLLCIISFASCSHKHEFGDWKILEEATCLSEGSKERVCSCGEIETQTISMLGHDYSSEWTVDIESTCSKKGSQSRHCSRCGDKTDITEIEIFICFGEGV